MAGEISFNPAAAWQYGDSTKNDDFMANLHFNAIQRSGKIPGVTETAGAPAFRGQLEADTFESSSGPGLIGTTAIAGAGGAAAGAGGYYLASNPIKDLEAKTLNPEFYATMDKAKLDKILQKETKIYNLAQLAKAKDFDSLPENVKQYLTQNKLNTLTPQQAQEALRISGINPANYENLDDVLRAAKENFKGMQYHANVLSTTGVFEEINNAKNLDELKAVIAKNKKVFAINGATEAEITQKVEQLAAKGNAGVIEELNTLKNTATDYMVKQENKIFQHVDPKTGKLLENADTGIKELFKNFKWQQAKKYGKWGALAAGTGALLYGLFSSGKKQA